MLSAHHPVDEWLAPKGHRLLRLTVDGCSGALRELKTSLGDLGRKLVEESGRQCPPMMRVTCPYKAEHDTIGISGRNYLPGGAVQTICGYASSSKKAGLERNVVRCGPPDGTVVLFVGLGRIRPELYSGLIQVWKDETRVALVSLPTP